jgi:asparagine N-glycosylation enzyme membrane subunit Stt3
MDNTAASAIASYIPILLNLIYVVAAGILCFRTKKPETIMFFVGAIITTIITCIYILGPQFGLSSSYYSALGLVSMAGMFIETIGLLIYALSLPPLAEETHHI